uniref:CAAX amino terminal protease family family n=1 Tax=Rheinheimera sp. BAL341 TaxID=1708203 RepID=A0A486XQX1_9GAMM
MKTILRREILLFYIFSCLISWPFMIWMQFFTDSWNSIPLPSPLKTTLFMWGPGISAILMFKFFSKENNLRRYDIFSGGFAVNFLIYYFPMILFVSIFSNSLDCKQVIFFLTLYNLVSFFNVLGEELGWRGYLQPNLSSIPTIKRFLIIGIMWEMWHIPMRVGALHNGANVLYITLFSIGSLLIAYLIGIFVEKTKSVSIAVSLHVSFNSLFQLSGISKIPQAELVPFFILVLIFYVIVFFSWNKIKR